MFNEVLVVCHANVCRSPAAEQLFRAWQREHPGTRGVVFHSAGLRALEGADMDPVMERLLGERGVEVGRHRARRLTGRLVRAADLVLVTERRQVSDVERIEPTARGKVYALGNWENADVVDPHGLHEAAYRESLALIERLVKGWLSRIC
ncbi:exopolysaccharide biosynthesis protein [Paraburkholderia caballeronis]|uniref:protein-tyrosine-phosphatase n=1 Tax=Paraburkholderia caballeronis TaxID=416943 RepID=A0A1H7S0R9_9BURK|nr:exopolysaccharide biosynthesis protein [Paraburkholderia caballeronis]PXW22823.1 protein tyrosine phosphatase [Paraburkholderia caballeronis]PXW97208.1 protein tyrosine phosphatase [Paraburkholderia caballeronis]RAJ93728.1 protein tyrosine phosphatase [Paraburkholderia caballeronis]TDV14010.1 protein tyrosine phosphatase [Paraburkholderia caballeronis]TDV15523.1 protein tyrosine phosphatase [Paraburkholderia caballeronis]